MPEVVSGRIGPLVGAFDTKNNFTAAIYSGEEYFQSCGVIGGRARL